jgi:acyl-CoA reductase-like NAD-dependent aldehyde dehydrogenase
LCRAEAIWEKPQGKNPPLVLRKHFEIVGRGVALVIGCGTFPTWNTYPGLFAALATGNAVIVKPHPNAILPVAMSVRIIREVLVENGIGANLVTLAAFADGADTRNLAQHPAVKSIDFTGGKAFGNWLLEQLSPGPGLCRTGRRQQHRHRLDRCLRGDAAQPGVHALALLGTDVHHLASAVCAGHRHRHRSGPQELRRRRRRPCPAIEALLGKPEVALAVLGAVQSPDTLRRIEAAEQRLARQGDPGDPKRSSTPTFPTPRCAHRCCIACHADDEAAWMEERFGPISFLVKVADTAARLPFPSEWSSNRARSPSASTRPRRRSSRR